jgi:hypothetical protein
VDAVMFTQTHNTKATSDKYILAELDFLQSTFKHSSYNWQILCALSPTEKTKPCTANPTSATLFPFVSLTFNCISKLVPNHIIKTAFSPKKVSHFL